MDQPNFWDRYVILASQVDAVRDLHKEEDGRCLGCPRSLTREGVITYDAYPCKTIQVMDKYSL